MNTQDDQSTLSPLQMNILFFSRGRGYGHAIPDLAIAEELKILAPSVSVHFASYATGLQVFRKRGVPVRDLDLPENNSFLATLGRAREAIEETAPTVVVAHEEFAAIYAAHAAGIPSVFVSAWLPPAGGIMAEALAYADGILVIGNPGLFPIPPGVKVHPRYIGPIIRKMSHSRADRPKIRKELGVADDAHLTLVIPGGASTEQQAPILDLVLSAFMALEVTPKSLFWVGGREFSLVQAKCSGLLGVEVVDFADPIERFICAADVVVTKGTRGITLDSAALGVPSISLSHGLNPIDDIILSRIDSNLALNAKAVNAALLAAWIGKPQPAPYRNPYLPGASAIGGARAAAEALLDELGRVTNQPS